MLEVSAVSADVHGSGRTMIQVIGASLPRAGHHYLVRLLRDVLGNDLHACEFYTPPGCCRAIPCRGGGAASITLQKNHDFDLGLRADLPGVWYLVQTREPRAEALSDYELWRLVDPVLAGDRQFLPLWLGRKVAYLERFRRKWVAGAEAAERRLVVPYERLVGEPATVLREILGAFGRQRSEETLAAAVARQQGDRGGGVAFNPRANHQELPSPLFADFDRLLSGGQPVDRLLELAAAAHGAALDGDLAGAVSRWEVAWASFAANPHVGCALWAALRAAGELRRADELAARLAARDEAWTGTALEVANELARRGELALALGLVERVVRCDPEHPPSHLLRAHILAALGQWGEAGDAAARFVRLADRSDLPLSMTPEQRRLRADFRGISRLENWVSAERFLRDRRGCEREGEIAAGMLGALTGWSAPPEAVVESPAPARQARGRLAAPVGLEVLVAGAAPLFAAAAHEQLAGDIGAAVARLGCRSDRVRLPWVGDRQGHLEDLEALLLLEMPGRTKRYRRVVALDLAAAVWAAPERSWLWLAEEPPALPVERAVAWTLALRERVSRGFAISATAAALARRRYDLDLVPLYPGAPDLDWIKAMAVGGHRPVAPAPELVLRWQASERAELALGTLARLPGRRLLVSDLPAGEVERWQRVAIELGVADRVACTTSRGEPLLAGAVAWFSTAVAAVDPSPAIAALALGRPAVITTDVGAARELIDDGEHGRVVAADVHELTAAVDELLGDDRRRRNWARAAAARGHRLDRWPAVLARLLETPG